MIKGVKGEIDQRPKRFYQNVSQAQGEDGWSVLLDARPIVTPARKKLVLPTERLAIEIGEEWRSQEERIDLANMVLTRTANVAIDRTPEARADMVAETRKYAETDLVCYFAQAPESLRASQQKSWDPWRRWVGDALGVWLTAGDGIVPIEQPETSLEAVATHADALDDFRLTGLVFGTGLFGSAVLGLAVERGVLSALDAFAASCIDETYQQEKWGLDAEAERVLERKRREAHMLGLWYEALDTK